MNILDQVCKHMNRTGNPPGFWTKEKILTEVRKHKTRTSFLRKSPGAYKQAKILGIYDQIVAHMERQGSKYKRALYAFEFADKSVYVGLTYSYERRLIEHQHKSKHLAKKMKSIPFEFKKMNEWFPAHIASVKEGDLIKDYSLNGWTILNKAKPGGLGKDKFWTKDMVLMRASKFHTKKEFRLKDPKAYSAAMRLGLKDEIAKLLVSANKPHGYWTKENVMIEAKKYSSRSSFQIGSPSAHQAAKRLNCLDQACSHMKHKQRPKGSWTKKEIQEIISKYRTYKEFADSEKKALSAARRMGLLNKLTKNLKRSRLPDNFWSIEKISKESQKYTYRVDFFKKSTAAYNAARKLGILDIVCSHMKAKPPKSGKTLMIDGVKYNSIGDLARAFSIDRRQVSHRLQWGWTPKQAVGIETRRRPTPGKSIKYKGKTFRSRNELARYYGIPLRLFESRIYKGWTIKMALETPKRFSRRKK